MKNKKNTIIDVISIILFVVILSVTSNNTAKAQTTSAPTINFYGILDAGISSYDHGSGSIIRPGEGTLATSRLGLKGSSPELGGIKFIFDLQGGLKPNTGTLGSTTTTGAVFAREAYVGVKGSAGEVRLGTTDLSHASEMDVQNWQFGNYGLMPINGTAIELGSFSNNAIRYISPSISGFSIQTGYTSGNSSSATTDSNAAVKAGSLYYSFNNGKVGMGYATKAGATKDTEQDAKSFGGSYNFGVATVGAAYVYGDNSTTGTVKSTASVYSVKVPLDKDGLAAHGVYSTAKDGAQTSANEGRSYTVGLTKTLAPGATVYAAYSKIDNDANSSMYLNTITSAPVAGKDPGLITIGINYSF
jgi:predicted porin